MKAPQSAHSDSKDVPARSREVAKKGALNWPLLPGIFLADLGLFLIGLAGWEALRVRTQILLYSGAAILCFAGLALIWIGTARLGEAPRQRAVRTAGKPLSSNQVLHLTA